MNRILVYSRRHEKELNKSVEMVCEKLNEIGFSTEQTLSTHWARVILNNYHTVHFFIRQLPLSVKEVLFISFLKALGKSTVLSVFDHREGRSTPLSPLFCPDALTLSQTNYFKNYRDWVCTKALLPLFPIYDMKAGAALSDGDRPFFIPLKELEEAFQFKLNRETYFDGRELLKKHTATALRKKWNQHLKECRLASEDHLVLSDEKIDQLFSEVPLQVVLARNGMKHTEFTGWLEKSLNGKHLVILNEFQATGFSHIWTSGRNCVVISAAHWVRQLNEYAGAVLPADAHSRFKISELTEPLVNELSRLYTKIFHQKTSLLSSDSVKIKP